jgi:hypothetical protein
VLEGEGAAAGEHGDEVEGDEEGGEEGDDDGDGEVAEGLTGDAFDEDQGKKTATVVKVEAATALLTSRVPRMAARPEVIAFLAAAEDRFEDDDGGIDEHADAEGEAAEGHDIEGDAEEVERGESDEQGHGDADADDGGGLEVAEEEVEHEDGQEAADDGGVADFADAAFDEDGAIGHHLKEAPSSWWRRWARPGGGRGWAREPGGWGSVGVRVPTAVWTALATATILASASL